LLIPRALVEHALEVAARDITLHAQTPEFDLHLSGNKVHFGTAGAAVHVVDDWKTHAQYPGKGAYRDSTLQDLYDAARLVDALEHIHFFQRCMVARDVEDPRVMDLNTAYASVAGTRKHCGISFVDARTRKKACGCCTASPVVKMHGARGRSPACRAASWCRRCASPRTRVGCWRCAC